MLCELDFDGMESYDEDAVQAAIAPGVAKARAQFDAVAKEMGGRPVDEVHAELVKRLEAEPFVWDAEGLRKVATSISGESAESGGDPQPEDEGD